MLASSNAFVAALTLGQQMGAGCSCWPACQQVRARTFYAEKTGTNVADVDVPVVGGHAGITILPLFSQATPGHSMDKATVEALTKRTQDGGTEVVQAKAGKVS